MTTATLAAPVGTREHHYPAVTASVPHMARDWAAKQLADLGAPAALIADAALVVSELVSNVHRHAPGEADLSIGFENGHAVISCADRGCNELPQLDRAVALARTPTTGAEQAAATDGNAEDGRGLLLVGALCAQAFARRRLGPGKRIFACISEGAAQ